MNIDDEILSYGVSRETLAKIKDFAVILEEWNTKINLVSKNSIKDIWERHILDSLQLIDYLPKHFKRLVDIGSGAGFPAIVLAIALEEKNHEAELCLVESITKKTVYLKNVAENLDLKNVTVVNSRVENTVFKAVDVVTARAVADLNILLSYQKKIGNNKTIGLYLKGQSYEQELHNASKNWFFDCDVIQNRYSENGVLLKISELRSKK